MDAAAIPLPSDDTTPPVTKMYLVISCSPQKRCLKQRGHALQVFRGVDAQRLVFGFGHANAMAILKCAQLFEPLSPFERADGQIRVPQQKIAAVHVYPEILE